jgi:hypothetical protein
MSSQLQAAFPRYGTVMNAIMAPANLANGFGTNWDTAAIALLDGNGYPQGTLSSDHYFSMALIPGYYGHYVVKWSGTAALYMTGSAPMVFYSGSNYMFPAVTNNEQGPGNCYIATSASVGIANPRVEFAFGWNIQSMSQGASNGAGGFLIRINTKTNYVNSTVWGTGTVQVSGANANTGANGTWSVTNAAASSFDLVGSLYSNAQAAVAGQAIISTDALSWTIKSGIATSSFSSLVVCTLANETLIAGGQLVDPAYVAQLQQLGVKWLRMMDISNVQASWETDFSARSVPSYMTWGGTWYNTNYAVGTIHNSGSDAYTCSAPSLTNTGAYHNGEIIQGVVDITNAGGTPTLNVNGRGAKKIITNGVPMQITIASAASSAGQTMQYTFTASWLNGGTPYVFTYTTTASGHYGSDVATQAILQSNVQYAMLQDATLKGKVFFSNSGGILGVYPLTPQVGALTIGYSGPITSTIINIAASTFTAGGNATFSYNYLFDAWQYRSGGLNQNVPLEYMVQLCNQVGANLWYTWPINTSSAYVTAFTNYVAANLNANLKFGTEVGNEMWNFGLQPWAYSFAYGFALGLSQTAQYQNGASYGYVGMRTKQYATASIAAWTSTRARSQHYILGMSAVWDLSNTDTYTWQGAQLDASANTTYGSYGGVDGIAGSTNAGTTYTTSPNRPIDIMDGIGCAPYWNSEYLGGDTGGSGFQTNTLTGTVAQNAPLLSAALQYQQGSTTAAYTALYNQFYTLVLTGGPQGTGACLNANYRVSTLPQIEMILRKYDNSHSHPLAVLHYESGPQFGLGTINNGTNDATTDIPAVQTHIQNNITNNSWDVSAYTNSGTNNANELATSLCGMVYNFKFSTQFYNLYKNYMVDVTTVHSGRECCGSQYGYSKSQWGLFPGSWGAGASTAYSSYQAISDFNRGA